MNFQDLATVENADFFLDLAFGRAKKRASELKSSNTRKRVDKLGLEKMAASEKVTVIKTTLVGSLEKIVYSYPNIDALPEFYVELIKLQIDYPYLKKSLGSISWAMTKIQEFSKVYAMKLKSTKEPTTIQMHMKAYYGRIASTVKQINKHLIFLEETRRTMKAFPSVKTKIFTVGFFGFPNVGKSTLLSKVTTAKPEISNYDFTTKKINIGYYKDEMVKIQFLDTPGALGRVDKMNNIEQQAYLAIKYCADLVVFVLDLTETTPLEKQMELLKETHKRFGRVKEFAVYLSKQDLVDLEVTNKFMEENPKYTFFTDQAIFVKTIKKKAIKTNF